MKRLIKRTMAFCLVFIFSFSFLSSSFAFSDVSGHWAEETIIEWADKGVVKGLPDGTFRPDVNITRAEFVTIINNVMNYVNKSEEKFIDIPENEWYAENVAKAVAAGVTNGIGNNRFGPMNYITRQEAAVMIFRAFKLKVKDGDAFNKFSDAGYVASWAKDAVSALTENNYVSGRPGNKFAPLENITRAEALKIIDNILDDVVGVAGVYSNNASKSLLVNTGEVTLKDMTVEGNLYLAEGIDDGNVVLDGVTVKGDIVVCGGGENSIILNNTLVEGTLYVTKYDGKIRIVASGNTAINDTQVLSGAKLEEDDVTSTGFGNVQIMAVRQGESIVLDGDFEEVDILAAGVSVTIEDGTVATLNISEGATGVSVEVAENGEVNTLLINAAASVTGNGTIKSAEIKADQVVIDIVPETIKVHKGYSANIGGTVVEGDYVPAQEATPTPVPTAALTPVPTQAPAQGGGGSGSDDDDDDKPVVTPTPSPTPIPVTEIKPSEIYIVFADGDEVEGSITNGNSAEIDLSKIDNSKRVKAIKIVAEPQDAILTTTKVGIINIERVFNDIKDITISSLLGKDSVSLGSIRGAFEYEITITGELSKEGLPELPVSLKLILGDEEGTYPNEFVELTVSEDKITAAVKEGKENVFMSDIGISRFMNELFGEVPDGVRFDNNFYDEDGWLLVPDDAAEIQKALAELGGKSSWSELTLGDLINKQIYFSKKTTSSITHYFTVNIIKANRYAYVRTTDSEVLVEIKNDARETKISEIGGVYNFLLGMAGDTRLIPSEVSIDGDIWYDVDHDNDILQFKSELLELVNEGRSNIITWSELKLKHLSGIEIHFKVNSPDYPDKYRLIIF